MLLSLSRPHVTSYCPSDGFFLDNSLGQGVRLPRTFDMVALSHLSALHCNSAVFALGVLGDFQRKVDSCKPGREVE
jgi:hypothetical protein